LTGQAQKKETIATYVKYSSHVRGGDAYWEWFVNGKLINDVGPNPFMPIGSKYVVTYDSLKPEKNYSIDLSRPVFLKEESTAFTTGVLISNSCFTPKKHDVVIIKYRVWDEEYTLYQNEPLRKETLCIKKGDKFEVEYWTSAPARSIVHLDKPVVLKETYATMRLSKWEYEVNGKLFTVEGSQRIIGALDGTKYIISYDSLHPERFQLQEDKPVFLKNEPTGKVSGTITETTDYKKEKYFTYTINGVEYVGVKFIGTLQNKLRLKKGNKYEVEFLIENPRRAIIHLDKPIK